MKRKILIGAAFFFLGVGPAAAGMMDDAYVPDILGHITFEGEDGKFYAGTLPLAQVYRFDGGTKWTCTGQLDRTPDVKYRRAWSMAVSGL